jgi:hypothetical protein
VIELKNQRTGQRTYPEPRILYQFLENVQKHGIGSYLISGSKKETLKPARGSLIKNIFGSPKLKVITKIKEPHNARVIT